jgi:hypothetical protein
MPLSKKSRCRQNNAIKFREITSCNTDSFLASIQAARFVTHIPTNEIYNNSICSSPHLVTLDLSWGWCITDEGLKDIVNRCRNIQRLILIGLHTLTGKPFKDAVEELPRLYYLDLCNCNSIIDDVMIDIATTHPSLSIINYYGDIVK